MAEERKKKQEEERRRKEELIRQREEEHREKLVYGRDRRAGGASGSGGGSRSRKGNGGSDDDEETGGLVLTREEKRQRRLLADLNKSFPSKKGHGNSTSQAKKAFRAAAAAEFSDPSSSRSHEPRHSQQGGSGSNADSISNLRKQLAAMPPTLVRLGTNKRDVRTIDEVQADLLKKKEAKVIAGEEARKNGFDWFGEQKKLKKAASIPSLSPSPEARASQSPRPRSKERAAPLKVSSSAQPRINGVPERKEPRAKVTIIKPDPVDLLSFSKINKGTPSTSTKSGLSSKSANSHVSHVSSNTTGKPLSSSASHRKRARSDSLSDSDESMSDDDSPPPTKRRTAGSSTRNDIGSEIWKLFGKDRNRYIQNDVFSDDDDDMEADAEALRREEARRCVRWIISVIRSSYNCRAHLARELPRRKMRLPLRRRSATRKRSAGREKKRNGGVIDLLQSRRRRGGLGAGTQVFGLYRSLLLHGYTTRLDRFASPFLSFLFEQRYTRNAFVHNTIYMHA